MQLANAIAIVANDGVAFRPHLVKSIVNLKTGEERSVAPEPTHTTRHQAGVHRDHQATRWSA